MELLLATGNQHKIGEITAILSELAFEWRNTHEWPHLTEIAESGTTYRENAILKARVWSERTGLWTLSDDSGLEVDALDGRPGVRSARYARRGEEPLKKLLGELSGVPEALRAARFVCVACLCSPEGEVTVSEGELRGSIGLERRGEEGFGFDPVFVPDGFDGLHLAEVAADVKNRVSHRANALRDLRPSLERLLAS